jgi:hypothetical protein
MPRKPLLQESENIYDYRIHNDDYDDDDNNNNNNNNCLFTCITKQPAANYKVST